MAYDLHLDPVLTALRDHLVQPVLRRDLNQCVYRLPFGFLLLMTTPLLKIAPRRYLLVVGLLSIIISHIPLAILGPVHASVILVPVVMTAVALMLTQKHGGVVVIAAASCAIVAGARHLTSTVDVSAVVSLFATHILIGLAHFLFVRSPFSPQQAQSQLAGRLKRTSEELLAARESQAAAEREAVTQTAHDRRTLLEHLPVHLVLKDTSGRFTFVSQSFCSLVGLPYDEIIGKTDYDLFPGDTAKKFVHDDKHVMSTGEVFNDVEETNLPSGKCSHMQVRKAAIRDRDGTVIGVQGIFWDVSEEYTRRKELQRIESRAHALINASLDAVLIVDDKGHVLDANPASQSILGYSGDEVAHHPPIGEIMETRVASSGGRREDASADDAVFERRTSIESVLKECTGRRIEVKLRRRDAAWFDAEISAHPLQIDESTGWAIFIRDISRRKKFEQELRSAKEAAERANVTKTEFVANVSHELRTPLTGIMGLQDLLGASSLDARQRNYIQLAKISASNLLTLINDLLDFSKSEAGHLEIEVTLIDLVAAVEDAAISMAARAQMKGLELLVDLPESVVPPVMADGHRIKQIILNLLSNAIKFTEQGQIRVSLQFSLNGKTPANHQDGGDARLGACRIEVHDSGIGVPADQRRFIFDAFRQADSGTTRRFGGTGLGLTICRDLVRKMGGTIGISDARQMNGETTSGSCFFLELPLEVSSESVEPLAAPKSKMETVVVAAPPGESRALLKREVQRMGYQTVCVSTRELIGWAKSSSLPHLFAAGNHTIVLAEYNEIAEMEQGGAPVVVKWVLLNPLANVVPEEVPTWLRHAEYEWLARPASRGELEKALTVQNSSSPGEAASTGIEPSQRTGRILLVEDSLINQTVIADMLRAMGHDTSLAKNGEEAVKACEEQLFDLVLMDIQMPVLDGYQATQQIRNSTQASVRRQAICALTAHASAEDKQRCADAGMNLFLVKPVNLDHLRGVIDFVLGGEALQDAVLNPVSSDGAGTAQEDAAFQIEQALQGAPDSRALLELLHNNRDLAQDVLRLLQREVPRLAIDFRDKVGAKDARSARRAIHTLKSNLRQVGLQKASSYAERLERIAKDERLSELEGELTMVIDLSKEVKKWAMKMQREI